MHRFFARVTVGVGSLLITKGFSSFAQDVTGSTKLPMNGHFPLFLIVAAASSNP